MSTENQPGTTRPENSDDLVAMLAAAEAQVQLLKQELERRRREQHLVQHGGVDSIAENLEKAQVNWQQVREFFQSAISEYRAGDPWGENAAAQQLPEQNRVQQYRIQGDQA